MITEEQFKRVKQLESELTELNNFIDSFDCRNTRTTIGLVSRKENGAGVGPNHGADRFSHIRKELIQQLNDQVINELKQDVEKINLQIAEHVIADEVSK